MLPVIAIILKKDNPIALPSERNRKHFYTSTKHHAHAAHTHRSVLHHDRC